MTPLPDGYKIAVKPTGNLLVRGPTWCFYVSRKAIETGLYKTEYVPALNGLIEMEAKGEGAVSYQRVAG